MGIARSLQIAALAMATTVMSVVATSTPAEAYRWRGYGAGIALGVGALAVGSVIAHRYYRPRYYYPRYYYARPYYYDRTITGRTTGRTASTPIGPFTAIAAIGGRKTYRKL